MLYVTGTARVALDAVIRTTDKGTVMTTVNVAWSDNRPNSDDSSFVQLMAFGPLAEVLADRVVGEKISVQGRLQVRANKVNGTTYSNTTVVVDRIDFESTKDERAALKEKHAVKQPSADGKAAKVAPPATLQELTPEQLKAVWPLLQQALQAQSNQ